MLKSDSGSDVGDDVGSLSPPPQAPAARRAPRGGGRPPPVPADRRAPRGGGRPASAQSTARRSIDTRGSCVSFTVESKAARINEELNRLVQILDP